jgi:uncharacterized YigZ family protein
MLVLLPLALLLSRWFVRAQFNYWPSESNRIQAMIDGYQVPMSPTNVELTFKNSRFIGLVAPAETVEAAKAYIAECRRHYPDASHHVYAFAVGHGASVTHGMSDDGEPSGTAGRPVLAVLRGSDLGDAAVVVVRYFGGTKLGTGGLVKAYTETAQAALAAAKLGEKIETLEFGLDVPYELFERCKLIIAAYDANIEAEDFAARIRLRLRLPRRQVEGLDQALGELSSGRIRLSDPSL